jgi:hypothetical protein
MVTLRGPPVSPTQFAGCSGVYRRIGVLDHKTSLIIRDRPSIGSLFRENSAEVGTVNRFVMRK